MFCVELTDTPAGYFTIAIGDNEKNVVVRKSIVNKKINIEFPKGSRDFTQENVINNAAERIAVTTNVDNVSVNLDIRSDKYLDCELYFYSEKMYIDFFEPCDVEGIVIVLDPGHGGDDVGAVRNNFYEKDIDLNVCRELMEMLQKENIRVYCTRYLDEYPTVEERVDFSNAVQPDMFISIHSNWGENSEVSGTSVLYNTKDANQFGSSWISNVMSEEVSKAAGLKNLGIVKGNDIHIVRNSKAPVALIEMGFMSNDSDIKLLTSEEGQKKIAQGIYNGIIRGLTELGKYQILVQLLYMQIMYFSLRNGDIYYG